MLGKNWHAHPFLVLSGHFSHFHKTAEVFHIFRLKEALSEFNSFLLFNLQIFPNHLEALYMFSTNGTESKQYKYGQLKDKKWVMGVQTLEEEMRDVNTGLTNCNPNSTRLISSYCCYWKKTKCEM